jgi:hypothetical protein
MMAGRIEEGAEPHLAFAGHRPLASPGNRAYGATIADALFADP